jgi:hypothetical protein
MGALSLRRHLLNGAWIALMLSALPALLRAGGDGVNAEEYLPAIKQELVRLGFTARCDDTARTCYLSLPFDDNKERSFNIVIRYSRDTDTVYIYIDRYLAVSREEGPDQALAKRLLALNNEMVTAKFEWDKPGGAIRLSTVINTDSNFDRRAFRSQLKGLLTIAERLWPELSPAAVSPPAKTPAPGSARPKAEVAEPPQGE